MQLYHVYIFHTPMLCLLFLHIYAVAPCLICPRCCTISPFSTLLHHVYYFHADASCLLFPWCCAISTFSTLLRHVHLSSLVRYVYFFLDAALSLLQYVYSFHIATLCLHFSCCFAISTFPCYCVMSTFSTLLCFVSFFYTKMLSRHV